MKELKTVMTKVWEYKDSYNRVYKTPILKVQVEQNGEQVILSKRHAEVMLERLFQNAR